MGMWITGNGADCWCGCQRGRPPAEATYPLGLKPRDEPQANGRQQPATVATASPGPGEKVDYKPRPASISSYFALVPACSCLGQIDCGPMSSAVNHGVVRDSRL